MRKAPIVFALFSLSVVSAAERAKMKPGSYPERIPAWTKATLRDIVLGSEVEKLPGFTCEPNPGKYRFICIKFLDERCKGKPTKIKSLRTAADIPTGQSCFYDTSLGGTYLDGKSQGPPLSAIWVVGTETTVPRAYEINYTFAKDVLTDDSNLGKALTAKYGRPDFTNGDIQWQWKFSNEVSLWANCQITEGPLGNYCSLKVIDTALLDNERSVQQAADEELQKKSAPPAPQL